jgi:hypothetical protein
MTTKSNKKKAKNFTLNNIDIALIDKKYDLEICSNISSELTDIPMQSTHIDELTLPKRPVFMSFLEDSKKYNITMLDSLTTHVIQTGHCFWCRHAFSTIPIGCPLKYVPSKILKNCRSEITKEQYTICQHISADNRQSQDVKTPEKGAMRVQYKEYYETDGIFCSFNCCMAFIEHNYYDPRYKYSKYLLSKMYVDIFGSLEHAITPSPSWRLLKNYGGYMDIEEFRASFGNHIFIDKGCTVKTIPMNHANQNPLNLRPVGHVFEETFIF